MVELVIKDKDQQVFERQIKLIPRFQSFQDMGDLNVDKAEGKAQLRGLDLSE